MDSPLLQCLLVRERLTALTSLWLHSACEVMDDKAPLQDNPHLQVTFDTLNKGYHSQWWDQLKRLYTKCPCNVALGNAGHFPEGLEFLRLHTYRPEPVSVSTDEVTHRPKVYPHQVGSGRQSVMLAVQRKQAGQVIWLHWLRQQ